MFAPKGFSRYWLTLMAGDFAGGAAAVWAGRLMISPLDTDVPSPQAFHVLSIIFGLLWIGALYFADLYALEEPTPWPRMAGSIIVAGLNLGLAVGVLVLINPEEFEIGRRFYFGYLGAGVVVLTGWRSLTSAWFNRHRSVAILIMGRSEGARLIADEVQRRQHLGLRFAGFVIYRNKRTGPPQQASRESIHAVSSLSDIACATPARILVLAEPEFHFPVRELLQWQSSGGRVTDLASFYEELTGKIPVALMRDGWYEGPLAARQSAWRLRLKRSADVALAILLFILTAPFALLVAAAVKLDSKGGVLYSQDRVGRGGIAFRLYKFRSMRQNAEQDCGAVWAAENDRRVTRVGRVLRRLRIDELPQLINVLKGDMSLVGPRPERPELATNLAQTLPMYDYRHAVRPGLTGWAQVCLPYGASVDDAQEKLCYDLYYVKHRSPSLDLQIALQTIKVVMLGRGSR
jgi:exopolysaccharide biosynthesis polyprenyl glycosylphosphotransferase